MAQFDIHSNTNERTRAQIPYLLDVQSDLLDSLATRVVVPLIAVERIARPITRLNPVFEVGGANVVMSTPELAGVAISTLGPVVMSVKHHRVDIINALDLLLTGA